MTQPQPQPETMLRGHITFIHKSTENYLLASHFTAFFFKWKKETAHTLKPKFIRIMEGMQCELAIFLLVTNYQPATFPSRFVLDIAAAVLY